jgi:hypothetical protein
VGAAGAASLEAFAFFGAASFFVEESFFGFLAVVSFFVAVVFFLGAWTKDDDNSIRRCNNETENKSLNAL